MHPYPLPTGLTKTQFQSIVLSLSSQLSTSGLDPAQNMTAAFLDEELGGKVVGHSYSIFISEAAAQILENTPNPN